MERTKGAAQVARHRGGRTRKTRQPIPEGWSYITSDYGSDAAWEQAVAYKLRREALRPDLFVRVKAMDGGASGWWWIIATEEPRRKEGQT